LGDVFLGLGAHLLLLLHLSMVGEVLVVLNLLESFLHNGPGLRLILHLGIQMVILFFLHEPITLPGVQDLVLSFLRAEMGFNGHSADQFGDSSTLLILLHLVSDGALEVLDLLMTVHVLVVHDSLLVLDVQSVLTDVVLVLNLFESNLTFVTLFGFLNGGILNWIVILEHTEVLNGGNVATVMESFNASYRLAGVLAEAVRRRKAASDRKSNGLGWGSTSSNRPSLRFSTEIRLELILKLIS